MLFSEGSRGQELQPVHAKVAEGGKDYLPPTPEKRDEPLPSPIPIPVPVSIPEMLIFTANLLCVFGQNFIFSRDGVQMFGRVYVSSFACFSCC